MNTHLGAVQRKLEQAGCSFQTHQNNLGKRYKCIFAGELIAIENTKAECIKAAAKALGEPI